MANEPSNTLTPREFARRAEALVAGCGLSFEVLDEKRIEELGMGMLLGVARGSNEPPRLMVLRHNPPGAPATPVLGLVGKGITFDTGGISIKPADGMERMKDDMAGGSAVVCAMRAIAMLNAPVRVIGIVPTTENMPGGKAIKPGDVLKSAEGKTVEVINTDAEGRLILGDGLWYARQLGATHLVDVATLTGAIVTALGKLTSGLVRDTAAVGGSRAPCRRPRRRSHVANAALRRLLRPDQERYCRHREHRRTSRGVRDGGAFPERVHGRTAVGAPRHRRHGVGRGQQAVPSERPQRRRRPHACRTGVHQQGMGVALQSPIIVKLVDPNKDPTGLADVLLTSLGLTGVMVLVAVVAGLLMAGLLFFWRSRKPLDH